MQLPQNSFLTAIQQHTLQYGIWASTASAYVTEITATTGHDWMLIDGEHSPSTLHNLLGQLQAVAPYAIRPVVRIADHSTSLLKQTLDVGAQTLMIPMVESASQAHALVAATRYAPQGIRGVGGALTRATRWGSINNYITDAHQQLCLIAQIESKAGAQQAEQIAAIAGIDAIFIGPADLSTSMGYAGDASHPEVQQLIQQTIHIARQQGKACGILAPNPTDAQRYIQWGCSFVAVSIDIPLFLQAAQHNLAQHKNTLSTPSAATGY